MRIFTMFSFLLILNIYSAEEFFNEHFPLTFNHYGQDNPDDHIDYRSPDFLDKVKQSIVLLSNTNEAPEPCIRQPIIPRLSATPPETRIPTPIKHIRIQKSPKTKRQKKSLQYSKRRTAYLQRIFACKDCDKCFETKYKLTRHIHTHTGIKPFICMLCEEKFNQKSSIVTHLQGISHKNSLEPAIRKQADLPDDQDVSRYILDRKFLAEHFIEKQ